MTPFTVDSSLIPWFIVGIAAWMALVISVGYFGSRGRHDGEKFVTGGRDMNVFLIFCTLGATIIGTGSTIGAISDGFSHAWGGALFGTGSAIGLILLSAFARVREKGFITMSEEAQYYYGGKRIVRQVMGFTMFAAEVIWLGNHIIGGATYLSFVFGIDPIWCKLITAAAFGAYVFIGGYVAVVKADGQAATLTLGLNGKTLATAQEVGAYGDLWCMVPKKRLAAGSNALTIVHAGGASVSLDNVEIIGSWQVGIEDNADYELSPEGGYRHNVFTLGNRNLKSKIRAIVSTGTYKTSSIRFYVPPELAKHAFKFTTRQFNRGANGPWDFHILLNGTEKYRTPTGGLAKGDYASFDVAAGELQSGWNTVDFEHLGSVWVSFDFFRMAISDYAPGMVIIFQ